MPPRAARGRRSVQRGLLARAGAVAVEPAGRGHGHDAGLRAP